MCGPTGIGVLYGKKELLENMPPYQGGGDMIKTVTKKESTWADLPSKFEAGTPNIAGAIGLGAAVDYLESAGRKNIHDYEQELLKYALSRMLKVSGLEILGPSNTKERGAIIAFNLTGIHPHDIAQVLSEKNICIRAGHHCAQPLISYLNLNASARVSFYFYNTKEEIDKFIEALEEVKNQFKL